MQRLLLPLLSLALLALGGCESVDDGPQPIVDAVPKITSESAQAYKAVLKARDLHGYANIRLRIAADGSILRASPEDGTPEVLAALLPLAPSWKFHPAMKDGQPVPYTLIVRATIDDARAPTGGPYGAWLQKLRDDPWAGPYLKIEADLPPQPIHRGILPHLQGLDGQVLLAFVVEADGSVRQVRVLEDTAGDDAAQAAVQYERSCTFRPAEHKGRPVPQLLLTPMVFGSSSNEEFFRKY